MALHATVCLLHAISNNLHLQMIADLITFWEFRWIWAILNGNCPILWSSVFVCRPFKFPFDTQFVDGGSSSSFSRYLHLVSLGVASLLFLYFATLVWVLLTEFLFICQRLHKKRVAWLCISCEDSRLCSEPSGLLTDMSPLHVCYFACRGFPPQEDWPLAGGNWNCQRTDRDDGWI